MGWWMKEREKMKGFSLKTGKSKILYTGTGNWRHYIGAAKSNKKPRKSINSGFMMQRRKCSGLVEDGNCVLVGGGGWE